MYGAVPPIEVPRILKDAARTVELCRSIRARETGAREKNPGFLYLHTRPGRGEMALIEIRSLQR